MKTYTMGFTQKNAQRFFTLVKRNSVARIVDVRLNNVSQLAGFAKRDDLKYFLSELCGADYIHVKELAPTKDILDAYKKKAITWATYEDKFLNLMSRRNVERTVDKAILENGCLLCSEHEPHHCHRRLVVEYLNRHWETEIEVVHLV
uniref:DUF488 domain-containing protein n=1 Tax=Candidatus Kentrum sp. MB TaxID=2138164 RepID=A0A451B7M4_9GAMM|nr:MAG: Protein of unknown function, DUF488 [Candidatus Kentron sp. MB]VFK30313.1 MAG: Protein of unknown function, DUF488 [Candidatus Kentron sp. MB]VFK74276.1 MAG: Protein of unknown function, DUF488 [Candidatus Kentron sp. MB]